MFRRQAVALFVAGVLLAALLAAAQTPRGSEIPVSTPLTDLTGRRRSRSRRAAISSWPGRPDSGCIRGKTSRVWIRLFRADGTPKGGRLRVSNSRARRAAAEARHGGRRLLPGRLAGGSADDTSVFGRRFTADGRPASGRFLLSSNTEGSQSTPAVAFTPGGGFVAAWSSGPLTYPSKLSDLYAGASTPRTSLSAPSSGSIPRSSTSRALPRWRSTARATS